MTSIRDPYEQLTQEAVNRLVADGYERLEAADLWPEQERISVIMELVSRACQSQNVSSIHFARAALARMPLTRQGLDLERAISSRVDLGDEWEYRRLLELLSLVAPDTLPAYIELGRRSRNRDVAEVAVTFDVSSVPSVVSEAPAGTGSGEEEA